MLWAPSRSRCFRKDCSPTFHSGSTAEALPQAAAVKVAMFVNREVSRVDSLTLSMPSSLVGLSHAHTNVSQQPTSAINPSRTLKRRFEQDYEQEDTSSSYSSVARDVAMERSPALERPRRALPKRVRISTTSAQEPKGGQTPKEHPNSSVENQDVDVGVLLG